RAAVVNRFGRRYTPRWRTFFPFSETSSTCSSNGSRLSASDSCPLFCSVSWFVICDLLFYESAIVHSWRNDAPNKKRGFSRVFGEHPFVHGRSSWFCG